MKKKSAKLQQEALSAEQLKVIYGGTGITMTDFEKDIIFSDGVLV